MIDTEKKRVLVVDDQIMLVKQLERVLTTAGFSVTPCYDGASALRYLETVNFDFLVTDHVMPGRSGLELVDYLCSQRKDTAVLLITSHHDNEELLRRVRAYPRSVVLVKPFPAQRVLSEINSFAS